LETTTYGDIDLGKYLRNFKNSEQQNSSFRSSHIFIERYDIDKKIGK